MTMTRTASQSGGRWLAGVSARIWKIFCCSGIIARCAGIAEPRRVRRGSGPERSGQGARPPWARSLSRSLQADLLEQADRVLTILEGRRLHRWGLQLGIGRHLEGRGDIGAERILGPVIGKDLLAFLAYDIFDELAGLV